MLKLPFYSRVNLQIIFFWKLYRWFSNCVTTKSWLTRLRIYLSTIYVYCVLKTSSVLLWVSLVLQLVKNLPAVWETWVQSLSWEDLLEKGKATPSSILAWVHGVAKSQTWQNDFHFLSFREYKEVVFPCELLSVEIVRKNISFLRYIS